MDPDETLRRIRDLTRNYNTLDQQQVDDLATLVIALDTWITGGGFLPAVWNASHPPF